MPHLSIGPAKPRAANPAHRFPIDQTSALPIRPLTPPRLQPRLFPLSVSNAAQQRFFAKPHTPTSRPACPTPDAIGSGETVPPTTCPAGRPAPRHSPAPPSFCKQPPAKQPPHWTRKTGGAEPFPVPPRQSFRFREGDYSTIHVSPLLSRSSTHLILLDAFTSST